MLDSLGSSQITLPAPPVALLSGAALFLDFDGTLAPIAERPDDVRVDAALLDTLHALRARLNGRLAIVSGRSVATLRDLGFGDFLMAGTHGLEFARPGEDVDAPQRLTAIDTVEAAFNDFVADKPGLLVERKTISVGLHFRGDPTFADESDALGVALAKQYGLAIQRGKMLIELRPGGADKGSAVARLMRESPMEGGVPIFIGDDVTDEEGFAVAVELGGAGILVGPYRTTRAAYNLEQVAAVRHYLVEGVATLG
ncbi:trehalose-phosphatase [Sphingobium sp.]|uniref:trehalose-phosphatase n=1 Tax=Sphingobium sp. TaxID=1912891 RepID=UPI003BB62775